MNPTCDGYATFQTPSYHALILKNLLTLKVKIILDGDDLHLFWIYSKIGSET